MNFINIFNVVAIVLMIVPNIIYAVKFRNIEKLCNNKTMTIIEHTGRIACIVFMVFPGFNKEFGFSNAGYFIIYLFGNIALLMMYIAVWISCIKKRNSTKAYMLAVLPVAVFLLCGLTLEHWILVFSAVLFGVGHIYVTTADTAKHFGKKYLKRKQKKQMLPKGQ